LTYQIGTRGANTVLRLKDGETQILAGLISDEERASGNKIPGLGALPLLGRLFGSKKDDDQRSEILLSITPRVIRSLLRPSLASAEFESGTENAIGVPAARLRRVDDPQEGKAVSGSPRSAPTGGVTAPLKATPPPPVTLSAPGGTPGSAPSAGFAAIPLASASNAPRLFWQGPAQVKTGQTFSVILRGASVSQWHQALLEIGYDAQSVQLIEVRAGSLFDPPDGNGSLLQQGDRGAGRLRVTLARPELPIESVNPQAVSTSVATADLLILNFKALKSVASVGLNLRQVDALPLRSGPVALPAEHLVKVLP
jgi:general secretion pathway protein D